MRKSILFSLLLAPAIIFANECVCFELTGEFGDEIKTILKKYTKNMGDKNITVIRENQDLKGQKSFLDSLVGITDIGSGTTTQNSEFDKQQAKKIYHSQCSSCHGDSGEKVVGNSAIKDLSVEQITNALSSYADGSYKGPSRYVKQTSASNMSKKDMKSLAEVISTKK